MLHPHTVKWGVNTYQLSLGGLTELLHCPNTTLINASGGGAPKRTKSTDLSTAVDDSFSEVVPSESVPLKTTAVVTPKEHRWRYINQNGYIRGSLDQQSTPLISDA